MSKGRSPWQDGRRAWQRLNGWHQDDPTATPGHPDDRPSALSALADIGTVRHLLDQAELVAVRTARRHRASWAEIATKLGVTRQSAWERWRDLDDGVVAPSGDAGGVDTVVDTDTAIEGAATELISTSESAVAVSGWAARDRRRGRNVVPSVIGLSWDDAREVLRDHGLVAVGPDPDGPPLAALGWPDGVVTDQSPESGARVPVGTPVTLWLERGGGSAGVREPRRPKPDPKSGRAMRYETTDEAVG
jgi:PASTA domain